MTLPDFDGITAVVTGAGSGLGRAFAQKLAGAGATVVVADIDGAAAEAVAAGIRDAGGAAIGVACDVSRHDQIETLADVAWSTSSRVDLLVNNAGVINKMADLDTISPSTLDWIIRVNVGGVLHGCATFVRRFKAQGGPAHIVNVGSEHSVGVPFGGFVPYTASKHAILGISDTLRTELAETEIGVSVMCPSGIATDLWQAESRRPDEFGGQGGSMAEWEEGWKQHGMDPGELADLALAAVRAGDFYVLSHANVRDYHLTRATELTAEFDRQLGPATSRSQP